MRFSGIMPNRLQTAKVKKNCQNAPTAGEFSTGRGGRVLSDRALYPLGVSGQIVADQTEFGTIHSSFFSLANRSMEPFKLNRAPKYSTPRLCTAPSVQEFKYITASDVVKHVCMCIATPSARECTCDHSTRIYLHSGNAPAPYSSGI